MRNRWKGGGLYCRDSARPLPQGGRRHCCRTGTPGAAKCRVLRCSGAGSCLCPGSFLNPRTGLRRVPGSCADAHLSLSCPFTLILRPSEHWPKLSSREFVIWHKEFESTYLHINATEISAKGGSACNSVILGILYKKIKLLKSHPDKPCSLET